MKWHFKKYYSIEFRFYAIYKNKTVYNLDSMALKKIKRHRI